MALPLGLTIQSLGFRPGEEIRERVGSGRSGTSRCADGGNWNVPLFWTANRSVRSQKPGACDFHFERLGEEAFRPDRVWSEF